MCGTSAENRRTDVLETRTDEMEAEYILSCKCDTENDYYEKILRD